MAIVKAKEAYSCQKFEMKTFLVTDRLWMVSKYKNINEIICDDSEGEKKKIIRAEDRAWDKTI